jgi:NAD(P)-dependent dehydrogenase (short-subunit alcohol dehydrogenase family)
LNRRVIVTGAASGLGLAVATRFQSEGAKVLLVDVSPEVELRARQLGERCRGLVCDLADAGCGETVLAAAVDAFGGCDTLINNAAWSHHVPFLDLKVEAFDRLVAINQRAPFLLTQAFARRLASAQTKPEDPCVIHITSVNAISGNPNLTAYAGTKGALESMTRAMAVELAPYGIRVNAVRPGAIDTQNYQDATARKDWDLVSFWNNFLIKHPIPAEEIADAVAFLCGPAGRSTTGSIWTIDGGYSAH